jgi:hypothetical protein
MTLFNVALSLLLPLALWPAAQALELQPDEKERYFAGLCFLVLFWPSALWLGSQNLKDMLLALLVALFLSGFVVVAGPMPTKPVWRLTGCGWCLFNLYLIFSLRSYLGAMLLLAAVVYVLVKEKRWWVKAAAMISVALIAASPQGRLITTFASLQNNFIINPEAQLGVNHDFEAEGQTEFLKVNRTPAALAAALPKTVLNPYPSIELFSISQVLITVRSVFVCLTALFFFACLWQWRAPLKLFLCLCMFLPWVFYWVVPTYSGPRQLFSCGIDGLYVLLLPLFWLRYRRRATLGVSIALGSLVVEGLVFVTAKALF